MIAIFICQSKNNLAQRFSAKICMILGTYCSFAVLIGYKVKKFKGSGVERDSGLQGAHDFMRFSFCVEPRLNALRCPSELNWVNRSSTISRQERGGRSHFITLLKILKRRTGLK